MLWVLYDWCYSCWKTVELLRIFFQVAEKLQLKKRQKKEEEQRLKLELKEIATKRQFLAANAEQAASQSWLHAIPG